MAQYGADGITISSKPIPIFSCGAGLATKPPAVFCYASSAAGCISISLVNSFPKYNRKPGGWNSNSPYCVNAFTLGASKNSSMSEMSLDEFATLLRQESETLFGPPANDWTYSGVEIKDVGPALLYYDLTGNITICLTSRIQNDIHTLIFQLAHEVCHLLHPSKEYPSLIKHKPTLLNEGISTYFTVRKMEDYFNLRQETIESIKEHDPNYYEAFVLVDGLMSKDIEAVKKLRKQNPRIDQIQSKDFDTLDFTVDEDVKNKLLSPFVYTCA